MFNLNPLLRALAVLVAAVTCRPASAQAPPFNPTKNVGVDQKLDAQLPLYLTFRDERDKPVVLNEFFGQRPVVLCLIQYRCKMLCTEEINSLLRTLRALKFSAGQEFNVLMVSFDPRETGALALAKKKSCLAHYHRETAEQGWRFLTGDEPAIRELTEAVGFRYRYDAETDQFAHAAALMVATPQGRVSRYLLGVEFPLRDMQLSLVEASQDKIGSATDQILLLCYQYNPATGSYSLAVVNVIRAGGVLTVLSIAGFILGSWRRNAKREARCAAEAAQEAETAQPSGDHAHGE